MQQLELPSTQYTKLIRYKSTLGCSSDAELIGLLTQTFLCTLAKPLSISSKEVDILLTQGQQEPKIRNIVMSLLVQFLSTHSPSQQDQPNNLSTNNNFNNLFSTLPSSQQEPVTSHNIVFLPPPQQEHVSPQNIYISPVKIEQLQSPPQSLLIPSDNTNSLNNQYDVQGSNQSPEPPVTLVEPMTNSLSTNDNNLSFNNNNIFNNNLTDNLTNNINNNNNNVVDLCDDKMEIQGPSMDHTPDHSMSPPCTNGGTPCGTKYCGTPCSNSGSNSPSKDNDWLDNLTAEQLLELTKQLKTDDSSDEILVNKLLTVINDLVDNTEFSLTDVVDLMKGSLSTPSDDITMETNDVTKPLSKDDVIANINNVISFNNDNNLMNNQEVKQGYSPGGFNAMNNVNGYLVPTTWVPIKLSPLPQQVNSNKVSHNSQPQLIPSKHEKKENVCNTCNTRFSQFSSLLRHIRQVHQKIKDKPCPVCGERFARSQYLPNHIWRTHYNRATLHVKCLFCEAVLDTKEGIQSHLWFNHVKARR